MADQDIGVALIGCGRIAGHHARSIQQVPGFKLAAVCDLVEDKAKVWGVEFGVPHFTNYHEMLNSVRDVGLVVIATPSGMHYEHAMDVMKTHNKSVVIEKPTFMRPSQLNSAYEFAEQKNLKIYPVFQNRYNKAVSRVRTALQNNELGAVRVCSVRVRWCRPQRYYDLAPWRGTFAQDGGALTNQGIHHIDLLRSLVGEIEQVNATMRTLGADIEVEDTVVANFRYRSGAVGALEVTTAARPDDFEASISFVCEKGMAQIGGIAVNELQVFTPDPSECAASSEDFSGNVYGNGHAALYRDIKADQSGASVYPVSKEDCLSTIGLLHAFYRSAESGTWVDTNPYAESVKLGRPDEALADIYRTPPRA